MSVLLEFSMIPLGKGESVSKYVAQVLDIIDHSGIEYRLGPMGTVIEGTWDEVMDVLKKCFGKLKQDCNRISCNIKIDYRRDREKGLVKKIESIENKLGRSLKTCD